jgi:hypothetical protein
MLPRGNNRREEVALLDGGKCLTSDVNINMAKVIDYDWILFTIMTKCNERLSLNKGIIQDLTEQAYLNKRTSALLGCYFMQGYYELTR